MSSLYSDTMVQITVQGHIQRANLYEQVTCWSLCCEPLRKMRVRLGPCKTGLSPQVILYYWSFQGDTSAVVLNVLCFGVEFLCCLSLHIRFSYFSSVKVTEWPPIGE